ncbi:hypothetical protein NC653_029914 [Populus alba x Populus x berolinensis]|uniref:Uncharacterized protein n=1 Tax=Populus alba x Populus x berolinensis TaxID=444605 RepID=A0AAD6M392_9ROSI|nr:hypothetical protein NC653_029914 [Populus alba x Populus x berolinensis]
MDAIQISKNLSNMGQIYEDIARGQVLGEDEDRVYSMVLPGLPYSAAIYFSGPGVVYSIKHDISDLKCLKPGLILAIRKVIRLKLFVSAHIKVQPLIYVVVIMEESSVWLRETLVDLGESIMGISLHKVKPVRGRLVCFPIQPV